MPLLAQYLLKLSCSLALIYLLYHLVLRKLTFYTANRWYLLLYPALSFLLPFINISGFIEQHQLNDARVVRAIPALETYAPSSTLAIQKGAAMPFTIWNGCLWLLLAGMLLLFLRLVLQYVSYRRIRREAELIADDGIRIYQTANAVVPFSFGNAIFINQHLHSETGLQEIICHEFVHVKQRHTADIIWMELLCIVNWYNPFVWLLRHAVRQNLEFIADSQVIQSGVDKREYQYLLLKVMDAPQFRMATPFNFSSLKKRIVMMNKLKSAKAHLVKFLFVFPLLAVLLVAFRNDEVKAPIKGLSAKLEPAHHEVLKTFANQENVFDTVPVPPPPPPVSQPSAVAFPDDYKAFLKRNPSVRAINWTDRHVIIQLKSGKRELYLRDDAKSLAAAEKKWGALPVAPPPPVAEPPAVDTADLPEDSKASAEMMTQEIKRLRMQVAQLYDSLRSGAYDENAKAYQAHRNEKSVVFQKKLQAKQLYLQQKQEEGLKKQKATLQGKWESKAASSKEDKMLRLRMKDEQAAIQKKQNALQAHVQQRQEALLKEQKAIKLQVQKKHVASLKEQEALQLQLKEKQAAFRKKQKAVQE